MGKEPEHFFQRKYTDVQQIHEKLLNMSNHRGDADQNRIEISLQVC